MSKDYVNIGSYRPMLVVFSIRFGNFHCSKDGIAEFPSFKFLTFKESTTYEVHAGF